jgi:RNA polymerase sigma-70 factor (ECF subfamily)
MEGYQKGDAASFEHLYGKLAPQLRGYLAFTTGNSTQADELLQETFLQIHRSRHTYRPPRPVRPWAFAIARHVFKMELRKRRRREKHETRFPESPWTFPEAVERVVFRESVKEALAHIPSDRREALVLHHALGLSFAEIGALLGIREGTAKLRAYRGLTRIRELLKEKREAP